MATMSSNPTQMPFDAQAIRAIFDPSFSTAIYGGLWTTNAFLPLIEKGIQKKIVHISSGMADLDLINKTGVSYAVAYSVAKAGMNVQVAKYAAELAPRGIKVLALSPGWVDTWEGRWPFALLRQWIRVNNMSRYVSLKKNVYSLGVLDSKVRDNN